MRIDTPDGVSKLDYRKVDRTHPDSGFGSFDAVLRMDARGFLIQRIFDGDRLVWVEECSNAALPDPPNADLSSVSCQSPDVTFYRYEPSGQVAEIYDALAQSTADPAEATLRFVYDSLGRVTETHDINKDAPTFTVYDAAGQVQQETNARGQTTTFTYDPLGRTDTITYPGVLGTDQYLLDYDDRTRELAQVEKTTSFFGTSTVFTRDLDYDALGRPVRQALTYQQNPTLVTEFDLDLLGRQTEIRYPDLDTEVAYEHEGAYLKRVCELGAGADCAAPEATPYLSDVAYDSIGRETALAGFDRHPDADPPTLRLDYDPVTFRIGRLHVETSLESLAGETLDLSYAYDPVGDILQVTDNSIEFEPPADVSFGTSYGYDARGRVASRTREGQTKHFTYDALGNLTGKRVDVAGQTNQTYDPVRRHRVTQAQGMTYGYDADGNVTQRGSQQIIFDALDRLATLCDSSTCDSFVYGADGIRLAGGGGLSPQRIFVGDLFEWETATGAATARIYALGRQIAYKKIESATLRTGIELHGIPLERWLPPLLGALAGSAALALLLLLLRGGLVRGLAQRPAYGSAALASAILIGMPPVATAGFTLPPGEGTYRRWVWEDPLGSGVHITDEIGFSIHQRAFEPFGEIAKERSSEPTDRTFATHEYEEASGLYYMNARWYDPASGRFLSTDPLVRDLGTPQSFNAYSYVENNPINLVDPTGALQQSFSTVGTGGSGLPTGNLTTFGPPTNGSQAGNSSFIQQIGELESAASRAATEGIDLNALERLLADARGQQSDPQQGVIFVPGPNGEPFPILIEGMSQEGADEVTQIVLLGQAIGFVLGSLLAALAALAPSATASLVFLGPGLPPVVQSALPKLNDLAVRFETTAPALLRNVLQNGARFSDTANKTVNVLLRRADGSPNLIRVTLDPEMQRVISAGVVQGRNFANSIASGRFVPIE